MKKVYRRSLIALLLKFISLIIGLVLFFIVLNMFFNFEISILSSSFLAVLLFVITFKKSRIEVIISECELDIFLGKKAYHYDLGKVSFYSEQIDNNVLTLYVVNENGKRNEFDLSLLGLTKFHQILEDLGIIGEKSNVIKIETQKKD